MWVKNTDSNLWERQTDGLNIDFFNSVQEDIKKLRYYAKCENGTSYLPINNLDDIYDILTLNKNEEWYVGASASTYSATTSITPAAVTSNTLEQYKNSLYEYNFTLKNLFTTNRTIKDQLKNYLTVDLATTTYINDLTGEKKQLIIDDKRVVENQRILVKNQVTYITLSNTIDPDTYFDCNYYIQNTDSATNTVDYYFYNNENGIYKYINNRLVKETDLDDYEVCNRYSVVVNNGTLNFDKQFHLSRLKNGYYPTTLNNNNIEFTEKHNWILRNKIEYQDILSVTYNDVIGTNTYTKLNNTVVPNRHIIVGNYGSILNYQDGKLNLILNKFKFDLNAVSQTTDYYYICGTEGTLLQMDKVTLEIKKIELNTFYDLKSISFYDDLKGIIVGKHNTIFYTTNGGYDWKQINFDFFENYNYNKVIFPKLDSAYIVGNEGVFIELKWQNGDLLVNKYKIPKNVNTDIDDTYYVVDNIYDVKYKTFDLSSPWNLTIKVPPYFDPISETIVDTLQTVDYKECVFMCGENGFICVYDLNSFMQIESFIILTDTNVIKDITNIEFYNNELYISTDNVYKININSYNTLGLYTNIITTSNLFSLKYSGTYTKIYNSNNTYLYTIGELSTLNNALFTTSTMNVLDSTYGIDFSPRFLFLDYDIASKTNFFDYNFNYRLPNVGTAIGAPLSISSLPNEISWIDYDKDSLKEFKYNTSFNQSNVVTYSTLFEGVTTSNVISFTSSNVTKSLNDISNLAPTFVGGGSISAPTSYYNLYLYQDLMILACSASSLSTNLGDVFYLESNILKDSFMVNNIYNDGLNDYFYFKTKFNEGIINDICASTQSIKFTNINKFDMYTDLEENFKHHPLSKGYKGTWTMDFYTFDDYFIITPLFNEKTAYYNMAARINYGIAGISDMVYNTKYLDFGYEPKYSLYNYLSNINPTTFNLNKEFVSLPIYLNLPTNNTNVLISNNKITFNSSLKLLWETYFKHTFIDVVVYGNASPKTTEKLLIIDKYYNADTDQYILECNNKIQYGSITTTTKVDVKSRRKLSEISSDLQELNNIQRPYNLKTLDISQSYYNYDSYITSRFYTDSYAQVLLNDTDIRDVLTAIVYQDYKNELAINITNLKNKLELNILSTGDYFGSLLITTDEPHNLKVGNMVILNFEDNNTLTTSYTLNPMYNGSRIINNIIDDYNFTVIQTPNVNITNDYGKITANISDPYFNYIPVDIIDVGINKVEKQSVTITESNLVYDNNKYSLVNLDLKKFKFKLVDSLSFEDILTKYQWILEAEIDNAIIGQDSSGIVWYSGLWNCGRFFGSKWYSGIWRDGDWYGDNFYSYNTYYKFLTVDVDYKNPNQSSSKWLNGEWHNGTFHDGKWFNGYFHNGTWDNGLFLDGQIDYVIWKKGTFSGGTWVNGLWYDGIFNSDNNQSYWLNGKFMCGDFESGIWYNGEFMPLEGCEVNFGTKSNNTRKAIFQGGIFNNGNLFSYKDTEDGVIVPSVDNRFTIVNSGRFNSSKIYGGVINGGLYENLDVYNCVVNDKVIKSINGFLTNNYIDLSGEYFFNIGDTIAINDRNITNPYSSLGSNTNPKKYVITKIEKISTFTRLHLNNDITIVGSVPNREYIAPYFKNVTWHNGIVFNCLIEESKWKAGMFMGGIINDSIWCS